MPESYFWYHFFGLSRVRNSTTFLKKIILTAARSRSRVRNRPTGELETVPPQRPFFHLEVVLFLALEVVLFLTLDLALCFPMFGTNWPLFLTPKSIIDMQAGQSVVLFLTLANLGVVMLDKITCFLVFCFFFVFFLVFSFFCYSHTLLCYVSVVPTHKNNKT